MNTSQALFAVAVVIGAGVAGTSPVYATSDKVHERAGPHWLDETIYRPGCYVDVRGRDWRTTETCDVIMFRYR
jgi:hypothetical protein